MIELFNLCLLLCTILAVSLSILNAVEPRWNWIIYFKEPNKTDNFDPFSFIVLTSDQTPSNNLLEAGKVILSYVDLKNLDVKEAIGNLIPTILAKKFDGIYLDNAECQETATPLIQIARKKYPTIKIMISHLDFSIINDVDIVVAKSTFANQGEFLPSIQYGQCVSQLKEAKKLNPKLEIFTLDFWNPADTQSVKKIYNTQRNNGFIPYVSTGTFDQICLEP